MDGDREMAKTLREEVKRLAGGMELVALNSLKSDLDITQRTEYLLGTTRLREPLEMAAQDTDDLFATIGEMTTFAIVLDTRAKLDEKAREN